MKIEIKSWYDGKILFEGEFGSLKLAVEAAVGQKVNLSYASLVGASLDGARLDGARLAGASLAGARLVGARLAGASLAGARLVGASLVGARLDGASLVGARLDRASLDGASLVGASLVGARLDGASLDETQLRMFRDDIWAVCSAVPQEVPGLLTALEQGKVDGSQYAGDCACLIGTIAKVRGCDYKALGNIMPNANRSSEQWFMQIKPGDTPETSKASKLAHGWIKDWLGAMREAFGKP